jgi:hypothetical protein
MARIGIVGTHLGPVTLHVGGQDVQHEDGSSSTFAVFPVSLEKMAGTRQLELRRMSPYQVLLLPLPDELQPTPVALSSEPITKGTAAKIRLRGVNFLSLACVEWQGVRITDFTVDARDPSILILADDKLIGLDPPSVEVQLVGVSGSSSTFKIPITPAPEKKPASGTQ